MRAFFECIVNFFTRIGALSLSMAVDIGFLLLVMMLPPLRKRYSAGWKCWVWGILAVRLLMPFELRLQVYPSLDYDPVSRSKVVYANSAYDIPESEPEDSYTVEPNDVLSPPPAAGEEKQTFPWKETTAVVWLAGVAGICAFRLFAYLSFRRRIKRWTVPVTDSNILRIYEAAYKGAVLGMASADSIKGTFSATVVPSFNYRWGWENPNFLYHKDEQPQDDPYSPIKFHPNLYKLPRLCLSPDVSSPMTAGIFRPVILLPQRDYVPKDLYHILRHELTHCKRRDVLYKQLFALVQTVHWFNPVVWLLSRTACQDMEIACDDEAVKNWDDGQRKEYAQTILDCVREQMGGKRKELFPSCTTWFSGGAAQLRTRIDCLFDSRNKRWGWIILAFVFLIFLNGLLVFITFAPSIETLILSAERTGTGNVLLTYTDDFDRDHNPESFAFVGEDETYTSLYYADENGVQYLLQGINAADSPPVTVLTDGKNRWILVESYGGSSTRSYIFYMKDGVPVWDKHLNAMQVTPYTMFGETLFTGLQNDYSQPPEIAGHGFLYYWYFWNEAEECFQEYGAIPITKDQLLEFDGAAGILSMIEQENGRITEIWYRANHIININYDVPAEDGIVTRHTYTLQYDDKSVNILLECSGTYFNEQLTNGGTYRDASIPGIAVYPKKFISPGKR